MLSEMQKLKQQKENERLGVDANLNSARDKNVYTDDLQFLNKIPPDEVRKLQNAFRNQGRGHVKKDKVAKDDGLWKPAVGSYRPVMETILQNDQEKLNKILPEPDKVLQK